MQYKEETQEIVRTTPPMDMPSVYGDIGRHVDDILTRLHSYTRDFYGNIPARQFVRRMSKNVVKPLQDATDIMSCCSHKDVDHLLHASKDMMVEDPKLEEPVITLDNYSKKLTFYVPRCLKVMQEVVALCRETEKYCQSFYEPETMVLLPTAIDYENLRHSYHAAVVEAAKKLKHVWHKYETDGADFKSLSQHSIALMVEMDCSRQICLLLVYEAEYQIEESCCKIKEWVQGDKNYVEYLMCDRRNIAVLQSEADASLQKAGAEYHNRLSGVQVLKDQLFEAQRNFGLQRDADEMLIKMNVDEEFAQEDLNQAIRMYRASGSERDYLVRTLQNNSRLNTKENMNRMDALASKAIACDQKIRRINEELKRSRHVKAVVERYIEKRNRLRVLQDQKQREADAFKNERSRLQSEKEFLEQQLQLVEAIIKVKACHDSAYKIFFNMARKTTEEDPVVKACRIVAREIRAHSWHRFYRALPHGKRGDFNVDEDIGTFSQLSRITTADRTGRALNRWRRFYNSANVQDVLTALKNIEQKELSNHVEKVTRRTDQFIQEEEEEEELHHVPVHLRPYYRLVERFDEMTRKQAEQLARQREKEEILKKYSNLNESGGIVDGVTEQLPQIVTVK